MIAITTRSFALAAVLLSVSGCAAQEEMKDTLIANALIGFAAVTFLVMVIGAVSLMFGTSDSNTYQSRYPVVVGAALLFLILITAA